MFLLLHLRFVFLHGNLFFYYCLQPLKLILLLLHLLLTLLLLFESIHKNGLSFNLFFLYLLNESVFPLNLSFLAIHKDLFVFKYIIGVIQFEILSLIDNAFVFLI